MGMQLDDQHLVLINLGPMRQWLATAADNQEKGRQRRKSDEGVKQLLTLTWYKLACPAALSQFFLSYFVLVCTPEEALRAKCCVHNFN